MLIHAKTSGEVVKFLENKQRNSHIIFEGFRGKVFNYEVEIEDEKIQTRMWNPVLYAIANPNKLIDAVKYMVECIGLHKGLSLKEPLYDSETDGVLVNG